MTNFNPMHATDAYKLDHRRQYPKGTTRVYSNLTCRGSRMPGVNYSVFFGLQAFLNQYLAAFNAWFDQPKDMVLSDYQRLLDNVLGPNDVGTDHIADLHDMGYLPLHIRAVPEGTIVPLRVPMMTVENTVPEFYWLTNYIETALSSALWLPITSATTAHHLRALLDERADLSGDPEFVDWQGHDFSMRGMSSIESGAASAAGHLLSFTGSDSLSAFDWINQHYGGENGFILGSVPATEHSVMCAGGQGDEMETFQRLLDLYPSGILSVVSDTWDLWRVLTEYLPALKDQILARDGKLVIRPDSGDPANILCGDPEAKAGSPASKGVVQLLWDEFGGTRNEHGFKVLDSHVGTIYGDSITYERADEITARLMAKGFASTTPVFGVGSYTYQYKSRDSLQMAMKATWAEVEGVGHNLFKDPVTDDGMKRSATGRLAVVRDNDGHLTLLEKASAEQEAASLLETAYLYDPSEDEDRMYLRHQSFADVRATLKASIL